MKLAVKKNSERKMFLYNRIKKRRLSFDDDKNLEKRISAVSISTIQYESTYIRRETRSYIYISYKKNPGSVENFDFLFSG